MTILKKQSTPTTKSSGSRSRRKGHNYEREIVKYFNSLGFKAHTTRNASRLMDAAKIDIYGIPYNIQCKAVEAKINYNDLTDIISDEISKLCPERLEYPIIIFHKRKRKTTVTMTMEEFTKLLKQQQNG